MGLSVYKGIIPPISDELNQIMPQVPKVDLSCGSHELHITYIAFIGKTFQKSSCPKQLGLEP